jgi:hypothetical protein
MWTWYQREGELWHNGTRITRGYSGAPGYVNNPDAQGLKSRGPVPRGTWTIGPPEDCCGGYALRLTGVNRDEPHRDHFLIHGDATWDSQDASKGCIILQRRFRVAIWESGDHALRVVRSLTTYTGE